MPQLKEDYHQTDRIVKTIIYEGREIGRICTNRWEERTVEADLSETELIDLVQNLDPTERIHLRSRAFPLYFLMTAYELDPKDFVTDDDIAISVLDGGYRNKTDLWRRDPALRKLVKERGLEDKLFSRTMEE